MAGNFIGHEPCPACRDRGEDRSGNNLGRYDDGHAWCFSCGYSEGATRLALVYNDTKYKPQKPNDLTKEIPEPNLSWLKQYLNEDEIQEHFWYSPKLQRHVYTHKDYWEARSVIYLAEGAYAFMPPKSMKYGPNPEIIFGYETCETGILAVVEDVISAIKVSRHTACMPLFGSFMSGDLMVRLSKLANIHTIVIWLDEDKFTKGIEFANKLRKLGKNVHVIMTIQDPKDLTDDEILEMLPI